MRILIEEYQYDYEDVANVLKGRVFKIGIKNETTF